MKTITTIESVKLVKEIYDIEEYRYLFEDEYYQAFDNYICESLRYYIDDTAAELAEEFLETTKGLFFVKEFTYNYLNHDVVALKAEFNQDLTESEFNKLFREVATFHGYDEALEDFESWEFKEFHDFMYDLKLGYEDRLEEIIEDCNDIEIQEAGFHEWLEDNGYLEKEYQEAI